MISIYIGTLLILLSPVLSFLREKQEITRNKKSASAWLIPVSFLIIGILGAANSFYNSKAGYDGKAASDSTAQAYQAKNDSLTQYEINYLGGGPAKPLFLFSAMSSNLFQFAIIDTASYPLRDVRITIKDELAFQAYKDKFVSTSKDSAIYKRDQWIYTWQGYSNYGRDVKIAFLTYNDFNALFLEDEGKKVHLKYTVDVSWSNGSLAYYIDCLKVGGAWHETRTCYDRIHKVGVPE